MNDPTSATVALPTGPFDEPPTDLVVAVEASTWTAISEEARARTQGWLRAVLAEAGVEVWRFDDEAISRVGCLSPEVVQVVGGWIARAHVDGFESAREGRAVRRG